MTRGVYRLSRNAFYVAFAAIAAGKGVWAGSLWLVGLVARVLILCHRWVITREEAYFAAQFAEPHANYRARVRR